MSPTSSPEEKTAAAENNGKPPYTETFHLRGHEYVITELGSDAYEKILRQAATDEGRSTDMIQLERLIALDAVRRDGRPLDADAWGKEPYPVVNKVQGLARRMHWTELETDEERKEREKAEKAEKAQSPNA